MTRTRYAHVVSAQFDPERRRLARLAFHSGERGATVVEFALILPVLVVLLFGMLDFGRAFNYWIDSTHLANEGARWAVVNKNPGTGTLQDYIREQADSAELRDGTNSVGSPLAVTICFPDGTSNVGDPVRVTAGFTYDWLPFLGLGITSTSLASTATMRLEALPTTYTADGACT